MVEIFSIGPKLTQTFISGLAIRFFFKLWNMMSYHGYTKVTNGALNFSKNYLLKQVGIFGPIRLLVIVMESYVYLRIYSKGFFEILQQIGHNRWTKLV